MARCCDDVVLSNKKPPDASSITMTGTLDDLEVPKESHRHGSSGGTYTRSSISHCQKVNTKKAML